MATIAGGFAGGKARAGRTLLAFTIIAACGISPASHRRDAIDRAVLGQRPGYGRASISAVPNLAAANRLIWMPGLDQGWDPQGLAVARGSLFVSGYRSLGTWQNRGPCRVFRVDPETGRETGHFDVPLPCGHAGGLAYAGAGKLFIADTHTLFEVDLDRAFSGAAPKFRVFPLGRGLKGAFAVSGDGAIWIGDYEETRPAKAFKFDLAALRSLPDGAVLSAAMAAAVVPLPSWAQGGAVEARDGYGSRAATSAGAFSTGSTPPPGASSSATRSPPAPRASPSIDDGQLWGVCEAGARHMPWRYPFFPLIFRLDPTRLRPAAAAD